MLLPKKKSGVNKKYSAQKFAMIGQSGIGKSSFWAADPKAFFIQTEAGLNAYDVFKLEARTWGDLQDIGKALYLPVKEGKEFPYSVVVIDTIDRLTKLAEEETIQRAKKHFVKIKDSIQTIGDIPNGSGWFIQKNIVMEYLYALEQLPCAIAYIGHLTIKKIEESSGNKYDKCTINIGGKVGIDLLSWADHIMNVKGVMRGEELKRTVFTKPTQSREAKSRGNMVPDGWQWDADSQVNYENFMKLFD